MTTAAPAAAPPLGVRDRRWPRRAAAVAAGLLIAASVPPIGFWPLGVVGVALLGALLRGVPARERVLVGFLGGLGLYGVTISWFAEFNLIGAVASMGVEAAFLGGAAALTPPGRGRRPAWVGALVLQDWARTYIPFGGVPLGGIPLGQAAGPLAPVARLLGELGLTGATALAAVALEAAVVSVARGRAKWKPREKKRDWGVGVVAVAFPVVLAVAGAASPSGHVVGSMRIALVQGGGQRGLRAVESNAQRVLDAQFQASGLVTDPVDVIVWPEDVIALTGPVAASPEAARVAAIARTHHATVLAGVTEDVGTDKFRNAIVVWSPDGTITGRYDKVHRVPFGEYVPGRWLVRHIVSLGVIPRDAIPGHGSGEVTTSAGPVGIVISYEIFFSARARSAVAGGGQVLVAPTNTASYTTTQVPAAEIAADRIRAWETGRDVVMVAPDGMERGDGQPRSRPAPVPPRRPAGDRGHRAPPHRADPLRAVRGSARIGGRGRAAGRRAGPWPG